MRNQQIVFHQLHHFVLPQQCMRSPISTHITNTCYFPCSIIDVILSVKWYFLVVLIPQWLRIFMCVYWSFSLEKCLVSPLSIFFFIVCVLGVVRILYIFWTLDPYVYDLQIYSPMVFHDVFWHSFKFWWTPIYLFFLLLFVSSMWYLRNYHLIQGHEDLDLCFLLRNILF